jgi:3-phenylpropionate/trans-cinnamate dioxygenase ferredoxin reductase subunit
MSTPHFVIVGGGLAGAKTAENLRALGFDGRLTLVGDESVLPYERPPLSKDVLQGKAGPDTALVHPESWYADTEVEVHRGTAATAIDLRDKSVSLSDGSALRFDKLALTTGSRPRLLDIAGSHLDGIHYLRRLEDSLRIGTALQPGSSLVIVGAGWIGLEVAAAARAAGVDTTVVEAAALPLLRVLGPEMAGVFADLHRANGVHLMLATGIDGFEGESRVTGVRLTDGRVLPADTVVVGVGVMPNVELAADAGLETDNGILADEHLRTSHPDVYVAGDVANAFHPVLQRRLRVEHWANALNQPAVTAAGMLGQNATYDRLPYFYTDQYDLGMEYVGHADPGSSSLVVRGDLEAREFVAFWLADGRVHAGMNVNVWDVVDDVRGLILSGSSVDAERLADPAVPLADV